MRKNTKGFVEVLVLVILLIIAIGVLVFFLFSKNLKEASQNPIAKIQQTLRNTTPTPTPFLFQEMTIPYLRTREFKSTLGELEKVSENQNYTSYVTSYESDGFKIYGLLTIPRDVPTTASGQRLPAIIFIHGYIPPEEYETLVNFASYVDFLARNGFVVFKIDLRGHGNSEGESGGGYYSGD